MLTLFSFLEEKFDGKHIFFMKNFTVLIEVLKTILNFFFFFLK